MRGSPSGLPEGLGARLFAIDLAVSTGENRKSTSCSLEGTHFGSNAAFATVKAGGIPTRQNRDGWEAASLALLQTPALTSALQAIIADPGTVTLGPWFPGRSQ